MKNLFSYIVRLCEIFLILPLIFIISTVTALIVAVLGGVIMVGMVIIMSVVDIWLWIIRE